MSANVTVLKDELGLQREYREVKRKASVGERVKYIWPGCNSRIDVVTKVEDDGSVRIPMYVDEGGDKCIGYTLRAYVVLEPTEIVHVNGERFREVKRKANVGERVALVNDGSVTLLGRSRYYHAGNVAVVLKTGIVDILADLTCNEKFYGEGSWYVLHEDYRVLEPLAPAQQAQIDGLTETVANLARRLSEVEAQLRVDHEDIVLIDEGVGEDIRKLTARVTELERGQAPREACEPVVSKMSARDEIIEKAKADVAELIQIGNEYESDLPETSPLNDRFYRVTFEVNRKKHAVVALVRLKYGDDIVAKGIAKCAPNDCFNVHIGMAIALHRALGLDIPQEYVNAPQPDEPRVGDVVDTYYSKDRPYYVFVVNGVEKNRGMIKLYNNRPSYCPFEPHIGDRIIDDSRDGRYGEVYSV
ncbi:hypothetical protein [Paenibacillus alvei]|uniref:hypothetical protein n=1 Tax=Paenibacillus alvei TaxID=44250 RepID=UPI0018CFE3CE|nr:hypothetical protein [Paenibacillus alvei]MCY9577949.1 hypothetical protein [Paenibacillus alvei]MCY9587744.1 hypothetical protein [Paenibacillus alvei]